MSDVTSMAQLRALALGLPEVTTAAHFDREAFKVGGKIFATLSDRTLNLRLTPEQQSEALVLLSDVDPCAGAWGRQGWTEVRYARTDKSELADWLWQAWRYRATQRILAAHDETGGGR
jgi:hypothetical protein